MLHFLQKSSIGLLLLLVTATALGQKKVIFEKMRCYSMLGPSMQYLENPQNQQSIARQLSQTLLQELQLQISDSVHLPVTLVSKEELKNPFTFTFNKSDTGTLHLYFDCIELLPYNYFNQHPEMIQDSSLIRRSESLLQLNYYMVNYKTQLVSQGELAVSLVSSFTRAIGIPYRNISVDNKMYSIATTATGFTETIRKSIQYLFSPSNESELIEIKAPPAFVNTNFINEETYRFGQLITPSFAKGAWEYTLSEGLQIIRYGERKAFLIPLTNKKLANNSPFKEYWNLFKDENAEGFEYFVFKNDIRDVINNSNYQLLLAYRFLQNSLGSPIVKPLDKQANFLLKETDTVAVFEVRQNLNLKDSAKLWPYQVYNGLDAASLFTLNLPNNSTTLNSRMEIEGLIDKQPFIIKIKGSMLNWKEIILQGETVAWVMGIEKPEKIFIKKNSLAHSMINQLLIIAFSPFTITLDIEVEVPVKR
ncbi:MAG: hypothetical protein FGM61_00350 [Sediminibacterium sp.]|nr:hypothetical protein [Sediminibacterium sp.]